MSITESSSKTSISQEVENPSSFKFSVPPPEESPSTPVCGVGEMDESISPAADILVSPVLHSGKMLVCSPTLVLSGDKSPNSEAQSMAKPNEGLFTKETNSDSLEVSSTISERVFERDLPEGKGPESYILTAGAELMVVQSLASLRGDVPPTSLESEPIFDQTPKSFDVGSDKEEEEEIPLKWRSRGMRGANQSRINISELEAVKGTFEVDIVEKSAEREKEQQRKGKGKLVLSLSKGDKMKYVTRSEAQKVMGSAIAASKVHTKISRKKRRERLKPEQPASTPLSIENSETESEEAVKYVAKRRQKAEEKRIKTKGDQKGGQEISYKECKEKGRTWLEEQTVKGPGPKVKNQIEEKNLTRKERVEKMEQQKVLNGRVFDLDILTQFGMGNLVDDVTIQGWNHLFKLPVPYLHEPEVREFFYKMKLLEGGGITTTVRNVEIHLDEETLGIILGVPVKGVRTIEGCKPSSKFLKHATKQGDVKRAGLSKKFLKGEYQLMFEFINKVMLNKNVTGPWLPGLGVIGDRGSGFFFRENKGYILGTLETELKLLPTVYSLFVADEISRKHKLAYYHYRFFYTSVSDKDKHDHHNLSSCLPSWTWILQLKRQKLCVYIALTKCDIFIVTKVAFLEEFKIGQQANSTSNQKFGSSNLQGNKVGTCYWLLLSPGQTKGDYRHSTMAILSKPNFEGEKSSSVFFLLFVHYFMLDSYTLCDLAESQIKCVIHDSVNKGLFAGCLILKLVEAQAGLSAVEWSKKANFLDWFDQDFSDSESYQESKKWPSQPHISVVHLAESKPLYRTSSYPQQPQQLQHFLSEPILVPKSLFNSFPPPATDGGNQKTQFISKYMTGDEIQSIMKMQHFSTHGNDPYVDDYYHQARLTKIAAETRSTRRFCPNKEQSSRPCVLLEFDLPGLVSNDGSGEQKVSEKPLEQKPTLAARITIEDGFYLLLEVDDIDRLLQLSQPQDGGAQLKQKRQILLEGLVASLQLVDPLGKRGSSVGLTPKDDIVFLWLTEVAETITNVAKTVAGCINGMDLNSLSACLAAIVYSSEWPPLPPLGSPAGDGASIILKSILKRPSHLLTDPQAGGSFSMPNPTLWQTSFDVVFGLLTKYCLSKYESII
ncbi:hypothetical protein H5410_037584 [Solanum commersonii]|uniref:Uncharacterized protein n=1 Tax=Solanum commersonii TaxID=4109 RepID=A0A9J5Y9X9_SOLCO|nr:hypothetical protein H5410_037584 [Solanum commersonii]